ncbi:MAG: hypothetical protein ACJ798_11670 [Phenylobacterium sp.]
MVGKLGRLGLAVSALLAIAPLVTAAGAQAGPRKAPDLTGLWTTASLTDLERPDDFKTLAITEAEAAKFEKAHRGKVPDIGDKDNPVGGPESEWWETDVGLARIRGQIRSSWIVSPADGKRPFNAAAKAARKTQRERNKLPPSDPEVRDIDERCLGMGAGAPLSNGGLNDNLQIVQAGDTLAIETEWMHDVRVVRIGDARHVPAHPPMGIRLAGGDSIARWDGDTLVIETTNFSAFEVNAPDGDRNADMRIVERLTRLSPTEILYGFSVTNPARFTQTWQGEMVLHASKGPIYEYACHEGNYALPDMLSGARSLERAAAQAAPVKTATAAR